MCIGQVISVDLSNRLGNFFNNILELVKNRIEKKVDCSNF